MRILNFHIKFHQFVWLPFLLSRVCNQILLVHHKVRTCETHCSSVCLLLESEICGRRHVQLSEFLFSFSFLFGLSCCLVCASSVRSLQFYLPKIPRGCMTATIWLFKVYRKIVTLTCFHGLVIHGRSYHCGVHQSFQTMWLHSF